MWGEEEFCKKAQEATGKAPLVSLVPFYGPTMRGSQFDMFQVTAQTLTYSETDWTAIPLQVFQPMPVFK